MTNVWKLICNNDMFETMRLLGFEKKYTEGMASDFECFREWCTALTLLRGHACEQATLEAVEKITGKKMRADDLASTDATVLWKECNKALGYCEDVSIISDENYRIKNTHTGNFLCDEKINKSLKIIRLDYVLNREKTSLDILIKNLVNTGNINLFVTFCEDEFCRPDRYHAENEYKKLLCGEKSNMDIITSQIVCEIIYSKKREKIQLIIDARNRQNAARGLVEYLSLRGLSARIFLLIHGNTDIQWAVDTCLVATDNCFTTLCVNSNDENTPELIDILSHIYPIGAISVVDI